MNQAEAAKYIDKFLSKNNYAFDFKTDVRTILQENRRATRSGGCIKYGRIPFERDATNRIQYKKEHIDKFCIDRLKPICEELKTERLKKAESAATRARLPYAS